MTRTTGRTDRCVWRRAGVASIIGLVVGAVLLAGCTGGGADDSGTVEAVPGAPGLDLAEGDVADEQARVDAEAAGGEAAGSTVTSVDVTVLEDRSVIYTVELLVEVDDVAQAADDAAGIAARFGGYVQSETTFGLTPDPIPLPEETFGEIAPFPIEDSQAVVVLRVPAENHLEAADALEDLGETISRSRNAQDVTEEVVDVESRIETQQASIDRLQALLAEASDISDILAIESELSLRIAELESLQARQEQLTGLSTLATLTVTFTPPDTVVEEGTGFVAGLEAGWRAFVRAIELGLTALGALLPFVALFALLLAPVVAWLIVRHRRRAARRLAQPSPPERQPAQPDAQPQPVSTQAAPAPAEQAEGGSSDPSRDG